MNDTTAAGATLRRPKPANLPARPHFSSGPCAKPPGWDPSSSSTRDRWAGRIDRSSARRGLRRRSSARRRLLQLPGDYRLGIVPASDTGAVEMALWALLGPKPVTMLAWESFGAGWVTDVLKQLKLEAEVRTADYGEISPTSTASTPRATSSSPGTARPAASASPTATGSPTTAPASPFATRLQRPSPSASTGRRSMSGRSAGRRRSAAKAGTACSSSARARSSGWRAAAGPPASENLPPDQRRRADRRRVQGRDDQHAVDAGG